MQKLVNVNDAVNGGIDAVEDRFARLVHLDEFRLSDAGFGLHFDL